MRDQLEELGDLCLKSKGLGCMGIDSFSHEELPGVNLKGNFESKYEGWKAAPDAKIADGQYLRCLVAATPQKNQVGFTVYRCMVPLVSIQMNLCDVCHTKKPQTLKNATKLLIL